MTDFLEHLSKDTLPPVMVDHFVRWCVWEQARPALVNILEHTGVTDLAENIRSAQNYSDLEKYSEQAGNYAHEIAKRTGPLGISTAEASAFLVQKLAHAAQEADWDPEGVSFFTIQVCGWSGFADTTFTDMRRKMSAGEEARIAQEAKLQDLWQRFGATHDE